MKQQSSREKRCECDGGFVTSTTYASEEKAKGGGKHGKKRREVSMQIHRASSDMWASRFILPFELAA